MKIAKPLLYATSKPKKVIFLVNFYSCCTKSSSFPEDCGSCIGFFSSKTHRHKFMRLIAVSLRGIWYCLRPFPASMRQKSYPLRLFHNSATIPARPHHTTSHLTTHHSPLTPNAPRDSPPVRRCVKVARDCPPVL
jgi:hypothetical protein